MPNQCEITGKKKLSGHRVSHANNRTNHFQKANIQWCSMFVSELNKRYRIKVSPSGIKILNKLGGLSAFVRKAKSEELTPRLRKLRKMLLS